MSIFFMKFSSTNESLHAPGFPPRMDTQDERKGHRKKGYFWSERFKSVIVEQGETLINCLAYIDLNAVRAGLVKRPEDYRWCSLGYHMQTGNKGRFLSLDFGVAEFGVKSAKERLRRYRKFVYEKAALAGLEKERAKNFELGKVDKSFFIPRSANRESASSAQLIVFMMGKDKINPREVSPVRGSTRIPEPGGKG